LNQLEVADVATNLNLELNDPNSAKYIDKDRFEAFLMSRGNDIFDPEAEKFDPEIMDRPLSEYWINSSHNTYLTGDQWQSRSSVEMYMNALYRGCRCLELDCFDGHRDNQNKPIPLVYHGLTITSKILFFDIIDAIKFFLNSNPDCYPIILSLENHCTLPFQEAMASYMISVFGNKNLFIPDETNLHQPLPSPEELKGKVLLKGRRITDKKEDYYRGNADDDTDSDDDSEIDKKHTNRDDEPLSPRTNASRPESTSFSAELSRITIFHGVRMNTFEESRQKGKDCMLSINESKARKLSKIGENRVEWVGYNNTHLSRVYPSGKRVDSSNFNPMISWSNGVQMCALNIQTPDPSRRLNDGRFRQNGNCGYVLKPEILRLGKESEPLKVSIQVLSGTCLPKAKGDKKGEYIDPYVQVTMFDVSSYDGRDMIVEKYTHHVVKNGFNPIWQHNPFKFKVDHPEIAMLQFTIWNRDVTSSDTFIGSASIPVSCVREGYRSVHLFDANNKRNGAFECASLLVDVGLKIKSQEIKMW
jgi:phosphatidylinositol phospholipase C delta